MTRLPTDTAIAHLVDSLRALERRKAAGYPKRIDDLDARLRAAVTRDRTGSVIPDGYPTTTGGGGNSGSTESSTERAGCALADSNGRLPRDRHHELTALAVDKLSSAVADIQRVFSALDGIDDLTKTTGPAPKTCGHCTGHRRGNNRPVYATGTVGDRLEVTIPLCKPCYGYVERSTNPGTRTGQLPTEAQILDHEDRGRWRMKVPIASTRNLKAVSYPQQPADTSPAPEVHV